MRARVVANWSKEEIAGALRTDILSSDSEDEEELEEDGAEEPASPAREASTAFCALRLAAANATQLEDAVRAAVRPCPMCSWSSFYLLLVQRSVVNSSSTCETMPRAS